MAEETIPLNLTGPQLDVVANALGHRPYIEAAPVLDVLREQVAAHNAARQTTQLPPLDAPPAEGDTPLP